MGLLRALCLLPVFCLGACTGGAPGPASLPTPVNPSAEIPKMWAWSGGRALRMGTDSGCSLPVVAFPTLAATSRTRGPERNGFPTAPLAVSIVSGPQPAAPCCHVVQVNKEPVQGLIGWPVIRRHVWQLDLARLSHYFHQSLPAEVASWASLPLKNDDVACVDLPGCGACILDTGAPYGLYLSEREWKRFLAAHPDVRVGIYFGESPAADGSFTRHYARVPELRLGPWLFKNIRVCESFSPLTGPRLLGRECLSQLTLYFDGPASRLYYRQPPAPR